MSTSAPTSAPGDAIFGELAFIMGGAVLLFLTVAFCQRCERARVRDRYMTLMAENHPNAGD